MQQKLIIASKSLKFYKEQKLKDNVSLLLEKNKLVLDHIIYQESDTAIQTLKEQFKRNQYLNEIIRTSFFPCYN